MQAKKFNIKIIFYILLPIILTLTVLGALILFIYQGGVGLDTKDNNYIESFGIFQIKIFASREKSQISVSTFGAIFYALLTLSIASNIALFTTYLVKTDKKNLLAIFIFVGLFAFAVCILIEGSLMRVTDSVVSNPQGSFNNAFPSCIWDYDKSHDIIINAMEDAIRSLFANPGNNVFMYFIKYGFISFTTNGIIELSVACLLFVTNITIPIIYLKKNKISK